MLALRIVAVFALSLLSACAYNQKLDKPVPLGEKSAIAAASDLRLSARVDAVIVRDGPGAWSKYADWDEYVLHVSAISGWSVEVTRILVVDSLGKRHKPSRYLAELEEKSKETARRYDDEDFKVTAGAGGALFATGELVGGASAAIGLATLGSSSAATGAAVAGAVVVAPVLVVAGVFVGVQEYQVQREIDRRAAVLPVSVAAGQDLALNVFVPLAPSPQRIEIRYTDPAGEHALAIDTTSALAGLHLLPKEGQVPPITTPPP